MNELRSVSNYVSTRTRPGKPRLYAAVESGSTIRSVRTMPWDISASGTRSTDAASPWRADLCSLASGIITRGRPYRAREN